MKVALVYDRVNKWGGAERVLLELHRIFPKAPLFTAVYDSKRASWAKIFKIRTSFLNKFPGAKTRHEHYPLLTPLAFESLKFENFDLVISITSADAKGIITNSKTLHLCYCLTPTRWLWSGEDDYFPNSWTKALANPFILYLKSWDRIAAQRPDVYLSISKEVQKRIKQYYRRDSSVIYPPVNDFFLKQSLKKTKKDFFLVVSRLVPYKRVDLAIDAFNELKLPLKIVGCGSQERFLRSKAGKNIQFLGNLTDEQLFSYYQRSLGLIMPQKEDFGLVSLEAQASGTPVIAFRKGGAKETIIESKTGAFFEKQTKESLIEAVKKFESKKYLAETCRENALRYRSEVFREEFKKAVRKIWKQKLI